MSKANVRARTSHSTDAPQPMDPLQHPNWDGLVANHPKSSLFHSTAWANVLVETYGYTPKYFILGEAGKIDALLPLMEVDSWLTGRRGVSLPFTDDCEPLCSTNASFTKLFQGAVEFGKTRGWKFLECRGGRKFFGKVSASLSFHGQSLNLTSGEDQIFAKLESSARRAIRKAEKNGVTVAISKDCDALNIFYSLQRKTRKKHGLPPQPFSFFSNIHKHVLSPGMGMIAVASHHDIPIAASVYLHWGDQAIYKYGASDEAFQHLRGSNLMMWEVIKWYLRKGATRLHLGRTSLANEGLRRFKLGWGAEENLIEYFKYDLSKDRFVIDSDKSSGWHNRIFQSLPTFASRMIGNGLYRHWA